MEANAADLHVLAVEKEAAVGAEHEAAYTERCRVIVAHRSTAFDARHCPIHGRPFDGPQARPLHHELLRDLYRRVARHGSSRGRGCDLLAARVVHDRMEHDWPVS